MKKREQTLSLQVHVPFGKESCCSLALSCLSWAGQSHAGILGCTQPTIAVPVFCYPAPSPQSIPPD